MWFELFCPSDITLQSFVACQLWQWMLEVRYVHLRCYISEEMRMSGFYIYLFILRVFDDFKLAK